MLRIGGGGRFRGAELVYFINFAASTTARIYYYRSIIIIIMILLPRVGIFEERILIIIMRHRLASSYIGGFSTKRTAVVLFVDDVPTTSTSFLFLGVIFHFRH
jgi:hypothetical protein